MANSRSLPSLPPPDYTPAPTEQTSSWEAPAHTLRSHPSHAVIDPRPSSIHTNNRPSDVVLSWHPSELYSPSSSVQNPPPRPPLRSISSPPGPSVPFGSPPGYSASRVPTHPIVYTFSPLSFNSMILIPPADSPDTRPRYHISVSLNCFIPSSYITTIRRGASEHGEFVGDFEMGISDKPNTLCIRGKEFKMADILGKQGSHKLGLWTWKFVKRALFWDCTKDPRICSSKDRKVVYAKFTPAKSLRRPDAPVELTQLEILPPGQEIFDDILLSALIIERWRLTPASGDHKALFN